MATTLSDLVSQVRDESKIDPNGSISSDALIERNLNRALRKIQERASYDLPENQDVATINVTAGTREYALPSDFKRVAEPQSVKYDGSSAIYPGDYNSLLGNFDLNDTGATPQQYYIRYDGSDWVIGFYPTPSDSQTVTVPYLKSLPEMSSAQDSPLPVDYDEVMVLWATYATLRRIPGYEEQANAMYQQYDLLIRSLMANTLSYNRHALRYGTQRRTRGVSPNPKAATGNIFNTYY